MSSILENMIKFESPKNQSSIIKVIGVGGGGSNAITHMYEQGIRGVDFIVANTDSQALEKSEIPVKIQLGVNLTEGMGAGSIPEIGRQAAIESTEEIKQILQTNTKMVFITAGMGGGTGTGAAPVIASIAKELGILTVGIVTIPFSFEGRKRQQQAEKGIAELRKFVDTLLIICNDKLRELHGNLKLSDAFARADNVLTTAAKGIAEIITVVGYINVDFNDVNTVMRDSGVAIMGTGIAEGENRAVNAVEMALTSPLLNDNNIRGAKDILLYISSGEEEISMDEVAEITDFIQAEAGDNAEVIWGNGTDETLGANISVTIIATGFNSDNTLLAADISETKEKPIIHNLDEDKDNEPVKNEKYDDFKLITKQPDVEIKEITTLTENRPVETFQNENENTADIYDNDDLFDFTVSTGPKATSEPQENISKVEDFPIVKEKTENLQSEEEKKFFVKTDERTQKLKNLSMEIRQPGGLTKIENTPAYKRYDVQLSDVKLSSDSQVSRYILGEDDEKNPELKDNSYLHGAVD